MKWFTLLTAGLVLLAAPALFSLTLEDYMQAVKKRNKIFTALDSSKEAANDTKRGVKKGARAVEDKACEMVNGKMECAAKKIKHSMQNGADKVEDAVD